MARQNQLSRYGAVARSLPMTYGKVFIVANSANAWASDLTSEFPTDSDGETRFFTSLADAYAACVSGRNDYILLDANSTHSLATGLLWSKSRINVVGIGEDRLVQQGAKIELTGAIDIAYLLKVTGVRNSFKNIKFIQSSTHANALNVLQAAGEGTYYENCSFMFGTDSNTDLTTSSEVLCGEDSGTFVRCSIGSDNLLSTGARNIFAFDAITGSASGVGAKNNRFVDCEFIVVSSSASAVLVKVVDTGAVEYLNFFKGCTFHAVLHASAGGVAITNAVQSIGSLANGCVNFYMPASFNCTNFCDTLTAKIMTYGPITSVVAGEAGTPT